MFDEEQSIGLISMEPIGDLQNLQGFRPLYIAAEVIGILAIILMGIWTSSYLGGFTWSSNPGLQFNWHPLLMTIAMIFLYANSILLYRGFRRVRKHTLKIAHAAIHAVAFLLVVIALIAVFQSHNLAVPKPIPNMYSLHSWMGLTAVILFSCQWVAGFVAFLSPGLKSSLRSSYMPVHIYFGMAGFVCAVIAALLGLSEKAFFHIKNISELPAEGVLVNMIGVMFLAFAAIVVYLITESNYKRYPLPEDELLLRGDGE